MLSSVIADYLITSNKLSRTTVRKLFNGIGNNFCLRCSAINGRMNLTRIVGLKALWFLCWLLLVCHSWNARLLTLESLSWSSVSPSRNSTRLKCFTRVHLSKSVPCFSSGVAHGAQDSLSTWTKYAANSGKLHFKPTAIDIGFFWTHLSRAGLPVASFLALQILSEPFQVSLSQSQVIEIESSLSRFADFRHHCSLSSRPPYSKRKRNLV